MSVGWPDSGVERVREMVEQIKKGFNNIPPSKFLGHVYSEYLGFVEHNVL